jgi:uncharacterized protein
MKNLVFTILLATNALLSLGQKKPTVALPEMDSRVLDMANLLTPRQEKDIFALMMDLETRVGSKIGIATIESLNGLAIEEYTKSLANQMALGGKQRDGILIVFSLNDRQFRTEVSVGLEKVLPNDLTERINVAIISPQFAAGNYAQGFYNGIKAFAERIEADKNKIGK